MCPTRAILDSGASRPVGHEGGTGQMWGRRSGHRYRALALMRLADGNEEGQGFPNDGYESLQKLWFGQIGSMRRLLVDAKDTPATFSRQDVIDYLTAVMTSYGATTINTQDFNGYYGGG